jgi:pimeloyl-ACP methyl ester carboxylesterase
METVTHDGRETAYRWTSFGEGTPLVYVHGSGGSHRIWAAQYGPNGVGPAAAVDLSGHGDSDDVDTAPGEPTLGAYADDVRAVARETGARVVVGNSMGGAVAMWIALERDLPLDALVLCGTGAKLGVADDLLAALSSSFDDALAALHEPGMLYHEPVEALVEGSREQHLATGRRVTERDYRTCDAFDVRHRLHEIEVPGLAITGERDGLTPPRFHEYLSEELPDCEVELLPDAAHLSMQERPAAWNDAVRGFLRDL